MKLTKDGNLKRWIRILLILVGIGLIYITVQFVIPPSGWGIALIVIGIVLIAIGGYASRAAVLKLKPFDRSWEKAVNSYKQDKK